MLKLKIASVGKTKEKWLEDAVAEYTKRLGPILSIEFYWAKNDEQLIHFAEKEPLIICLNVDGRLLDSKEFAKYVHQKFEEGGSRLTFIIGGAEGLPPLLRSHPMSISLSPLTMTHQITRLILLEQIYRAFEIAKGSKYHK